MGVFLVNMANWFIQALGVSLQAIILLLPESPFLLMFDKLPDFVIGMNWLLPISEMMATGEAWLGAIIVFYAYQIVLRWIKAIQ